MGFHLRDYVPYPTRAEYQRATQQLGQAQRAAR